MSTSSKLEGSWAAFWNASFSGSLIPLAVSEVDVEAVEEDDGEEEGEEGEVEGEEDDGEGEGEEEEEELAFLVASLFADGVEVRFTLRADISPVN